MTTWRKSTRSGQGGDCVEVRSEGDGFQVRDSKLGDESPIIDFTAAELESLINLAKRR